ncbi:MAG: hypothetical protein M0P17_06960 [Methanoculleus sp.]|nr:hypothetical protein [Methanoculleus sp.]
MTCRQSVAPRDEWQSMAMRTASGLAGKFTLSPPVPHGRWRSCTMQMLDAAVTPGTAANVAVSLAVTTLLIPLIPNRALAVAAGFAASSILRG